MEVARTNVFINNIIYFDQGKLFRYDKFANYEKFLSGNVYWRTDGEPILFAGHTWQEWRNQRQTPIGFYKGATMDQNSVIADPRFVDPEGARFPAQTRLSGPYPRFPAHRHGHYRPDRRRRVV